MLVWTKGESVTWEAVNRVINAGSDRKKTWSVREGWGQRCCEGCIEELRRRGAVQKCVSCVCIKGLGAA